MNPTRAKYASEGKDVEVIIVGLSPSGMAYGYHVTDGKALVRDWEKLNFAPEIVAMRQQADELARLRAENAELRAALAAPPRSAKHQAPLAFLTSEGLLRLPDRVREHLHLTHGGGVVFVLRAATGYVEMLSEVQYQAWLGEAATEEKAEPQPTKTPEPWGEWVPVAGMRFRRTRPRRGCDFGTEQQDVFLDSESPLWCWRWWDSPSNLRAKGDDFHTPEAARDACERFTASIEGTPAPPLGFAPEPPPEPSEGDVWQEIIDTLNERLADALDGVCSDGPPDSLTDLLTLAKARQGEGKAKYGTPLQRDNGRNHWIDAMQEALDLAVYLQAADPGNPDVRRSLDLAHACAIRGDVLPGRAP